MSLPTNAAFFKNGQNVNFCFVNCGWTYDEVSALRQVKEFLDKEEKFDYDSFTVYGVSYDLKHEEIQTMIELRMKEVQELRKKLLEERSKIDPTPAASAFALIRRSVPEVIAKEIVSVQPMRDYYEIR